MSIDSGLVKAWAKQMGADVVGIAAANRFEGAPPGHGPNDLVPQARSVVVAGIRIPDPIVEYHRYHLKFEGEPPDIAVAASVENLYHVMGHYTIDIMLNTLAVKMANRLEIEAGCRSFPTPNTVNTGLGHPVHGLYYQFFSQRHAATRAGLGEFGFSGLVLTPEFGPRVRFVSVITEAELEPDPLIKEKICLREKCGGSQGPLCLKGCTAGAIQLAEGTNTGDIFIDIPSRTERRLCVMPGDGKTAGHHACVYMGTCMQNCPVKLDLKKVKASAT